MRARPFVAAAIAGTSFLIPQVSPAVVVPFSENFDSFSIGTATPTDFTQTSNHYSVVAGSGGADNDYRAILSIGTGGQSSSAAVTVPGLAGNDFTVSTEFSITSFTANGSSTVNLGLGLLGSNGNFSGGSEYRVLFTLAAPTGAGLPGSTGTINIQRGSSALAGISVGNAIPIIEGVIYSLAVSGTYSPTGALMLAATVTNLTSDATTTSSATDATPLTGQYFGYRTAINGSGGSAAETINYDNFSVIPEPSTALALLSGIGILGLRRQRH